MPYEFPTEGGVQRLLSAGNRWGVEFNGCRHEQWTSPDKAAMAAVCHSTGLAEWDQSPFIVSDDLLRWRLVGENL